MKESREEETGKGKGRRKMRGGEGLEKGEKKAKEEKGKEKKGGKESERKEDRRRMTQGRGGEILRLEIVK